MGGSWRIPPEAAHKRNARHLWLGTGRDEADGLIARHRSSADERRLDIALTGKGVALRAQAVDVPRQVMARLEMSVPEVEAVRDSLVRFAGAVEL